MLAIYQFSKEYIHPIVDHPAAQFAYKGATEIVKIIAAKIFLENLASHFLNFPRKISQVKINQSVILAPIIEEFIFRFILLTLIQEVQTSHNKGSFRLGSTLWGDSKAEVDDHSDFSITIYPSLMEEMLLQGYFVTLLLINNCVEEFFNRFRISPVFLSEEVPQIDDSVIQVSLSIEQDLIFYVIKKGISLIEVPLDYIEEEPTQEERVQQVFRIHIAAFIFAVAHLTNFHTSKINALTQLSWSFLGGVIYGYLAEKYDSLFPGIVAHGINNIIAIASSACSPELKTVLFLTIIVNRVVTYLLGVTQIDKMAILGASQVLKSCYSSSKKLFSLNEYI